MSLFGTTLYPSVTLKYRFGFNHLFILAARSPNQWSNTYWILLVKPRYGNLRPFFIGWLWIDSDGQLLSDTVSADTAFVRNGTSETEIWYCRRETMYIYLSTYLYIHPNTTGRQMSEGRDSRRRHNQQTSITVWKQIYTYTQRIIAGSRVLYVHHGGHSSNKID